MFENEILSAGEKIKKLRKILNISQTELVKEKYTRNYLSRIERDNDKLSLKAAKFISESFNNIAKNKGINITITKEFLLKSVNTQAMEVINVKRKKLDKIENKNEFKIVLNEIEAIFQKYKIEDKDLILDIYLKAADFFFKIRELHCCKVTCNKGFDISVVYDNIIATKFLIKKSKVYIVLKKYNEALEILEHAERINITFRTEYQNILFNKSICYKNLFNYDKCRKNLYELLKLDLCEAKKYSIKILLANCYLDSGDLDKALTKYIEYLDLATQQDDKNNISKCCRNIAEIYYKKYDIDKAKYYIVKCLKKQPCNNNYDENLYFAAKIYKEQNEKKSLKYFIKSYYAAMKINDKSLIEKILYEIFLLAIKDDNYKLINFVLKKAKDIKSELLLLEIFKYSNKQCNNREILELCINIIKKSKKI